jgi:ubiquinone/menaquinone biosynthesis C-methylase UbiE
MTLSQAPIAEGTIKVEWDYTDRAKHYDKRADYSEKVIDDIIAALGGVPDDAVGDVGAGTGKLTKLLLARGLTVQAVEPNGEMRKFGIENTLSYVPSAHISWRAGTGEQTALATASAAAVFFGSSFNVVDRAATLKEAARVLQPQGSFCCMWNHRVLDDPIQAQIENVIKNRVKNYEYGTRREDPTADILKSNLFGNVRNFEGQFVADMQTKDVVEAWQSHATLQRQVGSNHEFASLVAEISEVVESASQDGVIPVPYVTRAWLADLIASA